MSQQHFKILLLLFLLELTHFAFRFMFTSKMSSFPFTPVPPTDNSSGPKFNRQDGNNAHSFGPNSPTFFPTHPYFPYNYGCFGPQNYDFGLVRHFNPSYRPPWHPFFSDSYSSYLKNPMVYNFYQGSNPHKRLFKKKNKRGKINQKKAKNSKKLENSSKQKGYIDNVKKLSFI